MTLENLPEESRIGSALTPTEQEVGALWSEILESRVPLQSTDNFFSLGGDSLAMTLVLFRINEVFHIELPAAALLESPELSSFAALLDASLRQADQTIESSVP
jgi:acyl carrier protein